MPLRRTPRGRALTHIGMALAISTGWGVLLAALAFPVFGGAGLAAKAGADVFLALPSDLRTPPPPQRSKILAADGSLLATFYLQNRVDVTLADVPMLAREALIAIEDSRFYSHPGIDLKGVLRAALTNAGAGGVRQGASTLTQQYVKNALIEAATTKAEQQAVQADTLSRKLQEARYALALEHKLTKDQILQRYLNIAYYGHGAYGIGAASRYYFAERVNELNLDQSALLAGMVQNPSRFDPSSTDPAIRQITLDRRNTVLARMAQLGILTPAVRDAATAAPIVTHIQPVISGCAGPSVQAAFFCDYVRGQLENGPVGAALGATFQERQHALLAGGLTIHTTLDPRIQRAAQAAVDGRVPSNDPFGAAAAIDVVQPGTGDLTAMAVNRTYSQAPGAQNSKVNFATGGSDGFQAGSTFKLFVLADALRMGIPLNLTLNAPYRYTSTQYQNFVNGVVTPYSVTNATPSEAGRFTLTQATQLSVNTYYLQLEERTGLEDPAALAESLGVHRVQNFVADQPLSRVPSFVLGSNGVSPLDMAAAYATFAAHGLYCPAHAVTEVQGPDGKDLALPRNDCRQAVDPAIANTVTSVLRGVIDGPDPLRTGINASIGRPAAGKTGTVNSSRGAWFIGYTPQLAAAVWVGKPTPTPMQNVTINGQYYQHVFGGDIPAFIWHDAMLAASQGLPVQDFPPADPRVAAGAAGVVPDVHGQLLATAQQTLAAAGFSVGSTSFVHAAPLPYGTVAFTAPAAGQPSATNQVTLYVSDGQ